MGWIPNARPGNDGGVGNTVEDILGIEENNLPIPNASEWELKCQRSNRSTLTTLFHMEPSPRALKFVSQVLLPKYGWSHREAGKKYPPNEMSFRQTINAQNRTNRGFCFTADNDLKRFVVSFDSKAVDKVEHEHWLEFVDKRVGLGELTPQPYWGFDDIFHKLGTKLLNCFYLLADVKKENHTEYFWYKKIYMLQNLSLEKFVHASTNGALLIDFDARTGHNHGTKFRLRPKAMLTIYNIVEEF